MQKQFKQYPCSDRALMTIVNDGWFSRGLTKDLFKLLIRINS